MAETSLPLKAFALVLFAQLANAVPKIGMCGIFPSNNAWNIRVDKLPKHRMSDVWVNTIGRSNHAHPDFGSGLWDDYPIGIPYNIVNKTTKRSLVSFGYGDESDNVKYPIPSAPLVEAPSDSHCIMVDVSACKLYEIYSFEDDGNGMYSGISGAVWSLSSNHLRTAGWTSADAAGLPIFPGLARYEEVQAKRIAHALRFTAPQTQKAFVWPARHYASSLTDKKYPPMGARFRLKKSFNISGFPPQTQIVLTALKQYGMMLADNGSPWYISGAPNENWDNDDLHSLHKVFGTNFEAVDLSKVPKPQWSALV